MEQRAQTALIALRRILRATELGSKQLARTFRLTTSQLIVLEILSERGQATAGAIAARAGLGQATVTALVDKLEQRGLVVRRRGEADRRQVWIELLDEGRRALAEVPGTLQTRFRDKFTGLEDWEQAYIVAALERVAALLDADKIDAAPVLDVGEIVERGS
ncbi:MarR family transcriptional regulator [Geminicoccaceae bacterium 1502E]|nr:MarR family transcriptional regulator [Geminicoccaceae bacterium 1502E]